MEKLQIADKSFSSRLFVGTGKFSSSALMSEAVRASGSELVTVALKRVELENPQDDILSHLDTGRVGLLPNTSVTKRTPRRVSGLAPHQASMTYSFLPLSWPARRSERTG